MIKDRVVPVVVVVVEKVMWTTSPNIGKRKLSAGSV